MKHTKKNKIGGYNMKKILYLLLISITIFSLTGCGNIKLSGKYVYGSENDDVYGYYECNKDDSCDWYMFMSGKKSIATYEYSIINSNGNKHTIHMKNASNGTEYNVIYDSDNNTIYDVDLKMTYERK